MNSLDDEMRSFRRFHAALVLLLTGAVILYYQVSEGVTYITHTHAHVKTKVENMDPPTPRQVQIPH